MRYLLILITTLSLSSFGYAADLLAIYQDALDNDPVFKQAYTTYLSNKEAIPQARAAFLPQLGVMAQSSRNQLKSTAALSTIEQTYNGSQWQVIASQAVFNYQVWAQVQLAKASVKAAQAAFNDAAQNLILRTTRAYMDVLFAQDTLNFALAKKRANKRQFDQADQRYKVGVDTITSVYEAKAAFDQSTADVIAAKNNQINQHENLLKLTNQYYRLLTPLDNQRLPLIKPVPNDVNEWVTLGLKQNYALFAAKFNMIAARENIKAQAGGGFPTVAIQGNTNHLHNDTNNSSFFLPAQQSTSNVALALNFPIFQGGLVQSQTRQAQYDYQTFSQRYELAYRSVIVDSRIAFNTIVDGISKVKADRNSIISARNSLQSTTAQFDAGTRTMVDVVNAQQRLFEAQKQLANDQYNLIYAMLTLKYQAGTLNADDIKEVNSWLAVPKQTSHSTMKHHTI